MQQLCDWAEHTFKLDKPTGKGATEREHLEQVQKQTGRNVSGLETDVEFPNVLMHVWSAFVNLSNSRSAGFSGPNPLTYTEIKTWMELTDTPLKSWEVEAIKRLDAVYIGVAHG